MIMANATIQLPQLTGMTFYPNGITARWGKGKSITLIEIKRGFEVVFKKKSKNASNVAALSRTENGGKTRVTTLGMSSEGLNVLCLLMVEWPKHKEKLRLQQEEENKKDINQ